MINKHHPSAVPWDVEPEKLATDNGGVSILFACHVVLPEPHLHEKVLKRSRIIKAERKSFIKYNTQITHVGQKRRLALNYDHDLAHSDN